MPQRAAITDITLRAAKAPGRGSETIWDGSLRNFGVRISCGGTKSFIILLGQGRRQAIGRYPVITLAQARDKASKIFAERTLGRHAPSTITWEDATTQFLAHSERKNRPGTHKDYKRILAKYFPFTGRLSEITKQQISKRLDRLADTPCQQNNALVCAKSFFRWAVNRGYLDYHPMAAFSPQRRAPRERVLSDDELTRVWKATGELGAFGTIARLLILTGQRRTEIGSLQFSWLRDDVITLPGSATKNGRAHTIPLGKMATSTLKSHAPSELWNGATFLFPARGEPSRSFNGWSNSKAMLDTVSAVTGWTLHDLRRTYATIHARIGTPIPVIEKLLNHVSGTFSGIVAVYQKHTFMPEMRAATETYENYLKTLLEQT